MIYQTAGEQAEGPGMDQSGLAGDGVICTGGISGSSAVPSGLYTDALQTGFTGPGSKTACIPFASKQQHATFLFSAGLFGNCDSGVCVDVSGLLLVCSGACLEGDPFVSDQKHLGKPAP